MTRKYFILIIGVFALLIFSIFGTRVESLVGLIHLKEKLGKSYVERANFMLANDDEQIKEGMTEKYVLEDSTGKKWMFKVSSNDRERITTLIAYLSANILGVNVQPMYETKLSINGINKKGFITEMLPSGTLFVDPDAEVIKKNKNILSNSLMNIIFSWWIFYPEFEAIELAITPSNEIYQVDMNNAYDEERGEVRIEDSVDYNNYVREIAQLNGTGINFFKIHTFIQHSLGIKDDQLSEFLMSYQDKYNSEYFKNEVDRIITRKKILLEDYGKLFSSHPKFGENKFSNMGVLSYRLALCGKLYKDILKRKIDHLFLKAPYSQRKLEVIASGNAWKYLTIHYRFLEEDRSMRRYSKDLREKIAITIYIRQIRTGKHYFDKYGYDVGRNYWAWIPITYNVHTFEYPISIDQWYFRLDYMRKGNILVVKVEGEDEYIGGLMSLINDQKKRDAAIINC